MKIESDFDINEWCLFKDGVKCYIESIEVHLHDGKHYLVYNIVSEKGWRNKAHNIELVKI